MFFCILRDARFFNIAVDMVAKRQLEAELQVKSIFLFISHFSFLSFFWHTPSLPLSFCQVHPSICPSIHPSFNPITHLSIHISTHPTIHPPIYHSLQLPIVINTFIHPFPIFSFIHFSFIHLYLLFFCLQEVKTQLQTMNTNYQQLKEQETALTSQLEELRNSKVCCSYNNMPLLSMFRLSYAHAL